MKEIYLLTSDGHRDSVELSWFAYDENSIKDLLIAIEYDMFANVVLKDSITVYFDKELITYKYYYYADKDDVEEGVYEFFIVKNSDNLRGE